MASTETNGFQDKLIMIMVVALMVTIGGIGYLYGQLSAIKGGNILGNSNDQQAQVAPDAAPPAPTNLDDAAWKEVLEGGAAEQGSKDAKVVMVEFTDYQCPFCGRHFTETAGLLQKDYIDTGKVRHITRDLPLSFHANAQIAAEAARCAGDQGKYWEMHDVLFKNQEAWSVGDAKAPFSGYAKDLGLNVSTFDSCVSGGKHTQAVKDDLALATKVGATGTPTFIINGELLVGAQPYASFQAVIDKALNE